MRCPCCVSEINDNATVCPVCRRDIQMLKSLLARIQELESRVAKQDELLALRETPSGGAQTAADVAPELVVESQSTAPTLSVLFSYCLLPLVLLLVAHGLIVVILDLNTLYLRVVSLLVPLPFSLLLTARAKQPLWVLATTTVILPVLAVLGMSALTAVADGTSILPSGMREWREFLEYAASIGLSYVTGAIVGHVLWRRQNAGLKLEQVRGLALKVSQALSSGQASAEKLQTAANNAKEIGALLAATGTTAASTYMGLKSILGG
jgi:hypothetical protein